MAKYPEIVATITALTATNSSVQAIAASSGRKLLGASFVNASTNTATAFLNHGTSHAAGTTFMSCRITTGQGSVAVQNVPGADDPDNIGMAIESGVFLRRIAGQPIVTLFTRKD